MVVGNPPYFNVETLGKNSPYTTWLKDKFPDVWMDKSDILFYFIARAIDLMKGRMGFIVSRSFIEADKAEKLRGYILNTCVIEEVIDFRNFRVFTEADISTAIVILKKVTDELARQQNRVRVVQVGTEEGRIAELMSKVSRMVSKSEDIFTDELDCLRLSSGRAK